MTPSPAMRISPRRELRAENHKRGCSLESGILFREKDDCLALFNEVQNKERENFLLHSNDDFDNIFSTKLRYFSDNKLEISIPARRESSDLLNAEGNKNDYDWLITPPETPLFPSLDDEAPLVSLASRGRPRSQPITMSRSSKMDKGYRSARSSASPHRLTPSPRSVNSTLQSKSRPFPATHSIPPPNLRHSSPSRSLSPSPIKPTPPSRASTLTPRRMSTGSAGPSGQSRARCPSPIKTSRGNSTSPKIIAWQSNIPGFSSEAPPNLRTSLGDRPASYVRGSSPASRNGFRSGRQSISPTASRSVSSSLSHERDQCSSFSKGSIASSGDDDVDSLQLNPVTVDLSIARGFAALPNKMGFSKKANKVLPSSASKRSFELALRQMERKGSQNMFRPLLSSVPSSTFYVGKESPHHRALTSRNFSITTSSNASSDQGTSGGALDTEESEQNPEDVTTGIVKGQYPATHDEIFVMDQADASNESIENKIIKESPGSHAQNDEPSTFISQLDDRESNADGTQDMEFCSRCSRSFHSIELIKLIRGHMCLCLECKGTEINSTKIVPMNSVMVGKNTTVESVQILEDCGSLNVLDPSASIQESSQVTCMGETVKDLIISPFEMNRSVDPSGVCWSAMVDVSEGTGISLLLKRLTSDKGHVVQSRSFTASNISCDDFSYSRDSLNSMRSSVEHSSASISSSVDLGSSRQTETHFHRQSSDRRYDKENYRYDTSVKHRRSVSSLSAGASGHVFPGVTPSCLGDSLEVPAIEKDKEIEGVTCVDPHEHSLTSECTDVEMTSEEPASHEKGDSLTNISSNLIIEEISAEISTPGDYFMQRLCTDRVDVTEVPQTSSLNAIWEIQIENDDLASAKSHSDVDSSTSNSHTNELMEYSVSLACNDVVTSAVEEFDTSVPSNGVLEESTIVFKDLGGRKPRSLTLEEATDAILFCSSIVHNLAYEAGNIAIGKDISPVEVLRPAVTSVGKSSSDRRDIIRSRTMPRRSSMSQKARQRKLETDTKPPPVVAEINEKHIECNVRSLGKGGSMNPPKLESKCNCTIM